MYISRGMLDKYIKNLETIDDNTIMDMYINHTGIEVEEYINNSSDKIVIGKIRKIIKHPNADKLNICTVDIGNKELQIVCGANNVRENKNVVVALNNSILPTGIKIKKSKIRGIESEGMLCSLNELGIDKNLLPLQDKEGIFILKSNYDKFLGKEALSLLDLNKTLFNVIIPPNRTDLLSYRGIMYETTALLNNTYVEDNFKNFIPGYIRNLENSKIKNFNITSNDNFIFSYIEFNNECYFTPDLIKLILLNHRIKVENTINDIFSYINLLYGIPVYYFDVDKLNSDTLIIEKGVADRTILINDRKINILKNFNVIKSKNEIVSVLGIGIDDKFKITPSTKKIGIYFNYFNKDYIQNISFVNKIKNKNIELLSKGIDYSIIKKVTNFTINLLLNIEYKKIEINDFYYSSIKNHLLEKKIKLDTDFISQKIGKNFTSEQIISLLSRLNFRITIENYNKYIIVPSNRTDITSIEDLIGEILRIYGWNKIKSQLPICPLNFQKNNGIDFVNKIKNKLENFGFTEVNTYLLVNEEKNNFYNLEKSNIKLLNPISKERKYIKNNNLYSILDILNYNKNNFIENCFIYEITNVFNSGKINKSLTIGGYGNYISNFLYKDTKFDFFVLKSILENLVYFISNKDLRYFSVLEYPFNKYHSAQMMYKDLELGYLGKLHPQINKKYGFDKEYLVANINLDILEKIYNNKKIHYTQISKFPNIKRDLTFIVDKNFKTQDLLELIKKGNIKNCIEYYISNIFAHENKKNITIKFIFNNNINTLKNDDINLELEKLLTYMLTYNITITDKIN